MFTQPLYFETLLTEFPGFPLNESKEVRDDVCASQQPNEMKLWAETRILRSLKQVQFHCLEDPQSPKFWSNISRIRAKSLFSFNQTFILVLNPELESTGTKISKE